MSLILLLSFFGLGNVGTQCFVRWISWLVKGLMTPFSKYSPIVVFTSVSNVRLSLCVGADGFGTECNGALTPFKMPCRRTLSAPNCRQCCICLCGPRNGHCGVYKLFLSNACDNVPTVLFSKCHVGLYGTCVLSQACAFALPLPMNVKGTA